MTGRERERELMVELQVAGRGVDDPAVLAAMRAVPREAFCPVEREDDAYADVEVPVGYGRVLPRPEIVGRALALLDARAGDRVLVVGAASGYVPALAARLGADVVATERVPQLAARAARRLAGVARIVAADGTQGLPAHAPYDGALVLVPGARAPGRVLHELRPGGRLVFLDAAGAPTLAVAGGEPAAG